MYEIYEFFDLDQIKMEWVEYYMQCLPPERKTKALHYRQDVDKKNCVISYLLLLHGLKKNYGIHSPRLTYSHNGKPYLPEYPNIGFNISHCPKGCICGISDTPIGVDIQEIRPFSPEIVKYCCSKEEIDFLKQSDKPAWEFTRMWTMKESYLKMLGRGIAETLTDIDTTKLTDKILTYIYNDCCIAVASAEFF